MTITNFRETSQPSRSTTTLTQLAQAKTRDREGQRTIVIDGAVGAQGSFKNFESSALNGPIHWDPSLETNFVLPHVEEFHNSHVFQRLHSAWTGPSRLPMIQTLGDGEFLRSLAPATGVDGFELTFYDGGDLTDPLLETAIRLHGYKPFRAGATVNIRISFGDSFPDAGPYHMTKKDFSISCRLRGTPLTVVILGTEQYEGRTMLRPFKFRDGAHANLTDDSFSNTIMKSRSFSLRHSTHTELTLAMLKTLVPAPHDLIAQAEADVAQRQMQLDSRPLLTQLTNR